MDWKELLSAHYDGELDAAASRKADKLLAESPKARAYLAELQRLDSALGKVEGFGPTDGAIASFERLMQRELGRPLRTRRGGVLTLLRNRWIVAASSLAAALVLAVALGVFNGGTTPTTPVVTDPTPTPRIIPLEREPAPVVNANATRRTELPPEDVLLALDMLGSEIDIEALAALDDNDIELLGDTEYLAMLKSYDLFSTTSADERGN